MPKEALLTRQTRVGESLPLLPKKNPKYILFSPVADCSKEASKISIFFAQFCEDEVWPSLSLTDPGHVLHFEVLGLSLHVRDVVVQVVAPGLHRGHVQVHCGTKEREIVLKKVSEKRRKMVFFLLARNKERLGTTNQEEEGGGGGGGKNAKGVRLNFFSSNNFLDLPLLRAFWWCILLRKKIAKS